ncbi:MAG TPA: aminotransferase class V-fold PLP-dependent enzyme, partial [Burkholderiaceae bacterium]
MGDMHLPDRAGLGDLRALFPVLAQRVNGVPLAYLDNAATTQMPLPVLDAMRDFEQHDRANIHRGVHTLSQRATDVFERARNDVKRFVGAGPAHELVFTSGTTEALNLVAHGLSTAGAEPAAIQLGDQIIVSGLEHHANLVPWQLAARRSGATLRILLPDAQGRLHVEDLARQLTPRTRVFALTACANATGERPPFEALLALAADAGVLTVLDAAQAVGHDVPDASALACDFMAFSGHKMYGPMGAGALVGRRAALDRLVPLRYGGDMVQWVTYTDACFAELPARLEGGTPNVAGAVGFSAAVAFIDQVGRATIAAHVSALRAGAAAGLARIDGITVLSADA